MSMGTLLYFPWLVLCIYAAIKILIAIGSDDGYVRHWGTTHRIYVVSAVMVVQLLGWATVEDALTSDWDYYEKLLLRPSTLLAIAPIGIAYWFAEHVRSLQVSTRQRFVKMAREERGPGPGDTG